VVLLVGAPDAVVFAGGVLVGRALRPDADPEVASMPAVLITGRADAQDTAAGFDARPYRKKNPSFDGLMRGRLALTVSAPSGGRMCWQETGRARR